MATKKITLPTFSAPWDISENAESTPATPEEGNTIGQYKLLKRLSEEGSAPVFKALNEEIGREEALKLIAADIDDDTRNRYKREINLLGRLDIPGIIAVYRCGTDTDEHGRRWTYFSMPLVRGKNLDEYIRLHNSSIPDRLRILERLAHTISLLHKSDILHKDIKPANVMVTENGDVRLLDLGIARLSEEKEVEGEYRGTPAFSSPEQLQALVLTEATDVYSFAVMAFLILSGRHPFLDDLNAGYHTVKDARRQEHELKLDTFVPDLFGPLSDLFNKALNIEPLKRPSMDELQQCLNESIAPASVLKVSLVIGNDCYSERAILDRTIRNLEVYYGKGLEIETTYGYSDEADVVIVLLWNSSVYLDDIFMDDSSSLKFGLFKSGKDPLAPEKQNLRETPVSNQAAKAGFTIIEFNDLAELERLFFRFLRRSLKSLYPDTRRIPQRSWNEAPYLGLKTFEYRYAPVFFGRTFALSRCLDFLRLQRAHGHNLLMIHGSSGCGKSSLVRAALLPMLCENSLYENVSLWDYVIIEFNTKEITWQEQVRQAISEKLDEPVKSTTTEISNNEIDHWLTDTAYANGTGKNQCGLIFFFDQLESFFSQESEVEQRHYFDEFLMEISSRPNIIVIATMRSDFLPALNSLPCFQEETRSHGLFQLVAPNEYELNEIIRYPAVAAGLSFEDDPETGSGLEQSLCREAINSPEGLPLLEFLLSELYALARADGLITWDEYKRLGGIAGALSRKAEQTLQQLPESCQLALPRVILKLMSLTHENNLIRKWMPLEEAAETTNNRTLIDHFTNNRLFVVNRKNNRSIVSVSHEALIRSWPRVTEMARFHQDFLRFRTNLDLPLKAWERSLAKNKSELLLTNPLLREGAHFLNVSPELLTRREKGYLQESMLHRSRRSHQKNRTRLRYAKAIIIISLLSVIITVVGSIIIYRQYNRERKTKIEVSDLRDSKNKLIDEITQQKLALKVLEKQKSIIDKDNSIRRANIKISQLASKLKRGTPKFLESLKLLNAIKPDRRSWEWGHLYAKALPDYKPLIQHSSEVVSITASPNGRYVVTASWDETAIVWDAKTGKAIQQLDDGLGHDIEYATFSPDGKWVLTSSDHGRVTLWDFNSLNPLAPTKRSFKASKRAIRGLSFSPDGRFLLTCDDLGAIRSWDWQGKNFKTSLSAVFHSKDNRCTKTLFSPDGSFFASCGWTSTPLTWKISDSGVISKLHVYKHSTQHTKVVRDICFIDNQKLVSVSQDQTLIIWDTKTQIPIWKDTPNDSDITSVVYLEQYKLLATASQNGRIILKKPLSKSIHRQFNLFADAVKCLTTLPQSDELLASGNDNSACIIPLKNQAQKKVNHYQDYNIDEAKAFCMADSNNTIYTIDANGDIYAVLPATNTKKLHLKTGYTIGDNTVVSFSHQEDNNYFIIALNNGSIIEYINGTMKTQETYLNLTIAKTSPDGGHSAFITSDNKVHLYKTQPDSIFTKAILTEQSFNNLCWLSPNKLLLIDDSFYVYEYSLSNGKLEELFHPPLKRQIYQMSAKVTMQGPSCLITSRDNKAVLTYLKDLKSFEFDHHPRSDVFAVALSPDSKRIVSICQRNNSPFLWNANSEDELFSLDPLPSPIHQVAFSQDGKLIVCLDRDNTLRVYLSIDSQRVLKY